MLKLSTEERALWESPLRHGFASQETTKCGTLHPEGTGAGEKILENQKKGSL
jgi:hypothetical protein